MSNWKKTVIVFAAFLVIGIYVATSPKSEDVVYNQTPEAPEITTLPQIKFMDSTGSAYIATIRIESYKKYENLEAVVNKIVVSTGAKSRSNSMASDIGFALSNANFIPVTVMITRINY